MTIFTKVVTTERKAYLVKADDTVEEHIHTHAKGIPTLRDFKPEFIDSFFYIPELNIVALFVNESKDTMPVWRRISKPERTPKMKSYALLLGV